MLLLNQCWERFRSEIVQVQVVVQVLFNLRVVENDRCSKLIVQLLKFITRLVYSLKIALHSFTVVNLKRDIQLLSGSFESVPNWLNWGC